MLTATIRFSPDFLIEATRRYRRQHWARPLRLAVKILVVVLCAPLAVLLFRDGLYSPGALLALAALLMAFLHGFDYWTIRRAFRKSPYCNEDVLLELDENGYHARSRQLDTRLQWSLFTRVVHFRDGFLLLQGPQVFVWLPQRCLKSSKEREQLEGLLRSRIADHRVLESPAPANSRAPDEPAASLARGGRVQDRP